MYYARDYDVGTLYMVSDDFEVKSVRVAQVRSLVSDICSEQGVCEAEIWYEENQFFLSGDTEGKHRYFFLFLGPDCDVALRLAPLMKVASDRAYELAEKEGKSSQRNCEYFAYKAAESVAVEESERLS